MKSNNSNPVKRNLSCLHVGIDVLRCCWPKKGLSPCIAAIENARDTNRRWGSRDLPDARNIDWRRADGMKGVLGDERRGKRRAVNLLWCKRRLAKGYDWATAVVPGLDRKIEGEGIWRGLTQATDYLILSDSKVEVAIEEGMRERARVEVTREDECEIR